MAEIEHPEAKPEDGQPMARDLEALLLRPEDWQAIVETARVVARQWNEGTGFLEEAKGSREDPRTRRRCIEAHLLKSVQTVALVDIRRSASQPRVRMPIDAKRALSEILDDRG